MGENRIGMCPRPQRAFRALGIRTNVFLGTYLKEAITTTIEGRSGPCGYRENATMRRLENYVKKYGPEFGPILYHTLQSQAAHAGVSARLRRKIGVLTGKTALPPRKRPVRQALPLFPETAPEAALLEKGEVLAVGA
jgi:hypothetical protein